MRTRRMTAPDWRRRVLAAALVLAAGAVSAACGESSVEPEPEEVLQTLTGVLKFEYTGADKGNFAVSATWPFDPKKPGMMDTKAFQAAHPDWAVAYPFAPQNATVIVAQHRRPDGWWDVFELMVPGGPVTSPRTVELWDGTAGYGGEFVIGTGGGGPLAYYSVEKGSVTFSSVSEDRLKGTFVAQLVVAKTAKRIEVRGSFDVPVIPTSPY